MELDGRKSESEKKVTVHHEDLELEFQAACQIAIEECRTLRTPYNPTIWIQMIERHGAAEAARRLLVSGDIQDGFAHLIEQGRPDLTVEWAVLQPQWDLLFTEGHRQAARWRLQQAGVNPIP